MFNELWKQFEFTKFCYIVKFLDFEIVGNFCVHHFFIWKCFGVQIVGTTGCMKAFVQRNCENILNFKIYSIIKL